jgi:uncharacterized protein YjcR
MNIKDKKDWAKLLYLKENLNQKEIAAKVHVTEKTMGKWLHDEKWELLKASVVTSKAESLRRLYMQINEVNTAISNKPEGERYADNKQADILSKVSATIKNLETETSITDVIDVFIQFIDWLRPIDLDKAKEIILLQDAFIRYKMK